jgi:hypothetical protein
MECHPSQVSQMTPVSAPKALNNTILQSARKWLLNEAAAILLTGVDWKSVKEADAFYGLHPSI